MPCDIKTMLDKSVMLLSVCMSMGPCISGSRSILVSKFVTGTSKQHQQEVKSTNKLPPDEKILVVDEQTAIDCIEITIRECVPVQEMCVLRGEAMYISVIDFQNGFQWLSHSLFDCDYMHQV